MDTTVGEVLRVAAQTLGRAGIETSRLDVLVLLEDITGISRSSLLAHPEIELSKTQYIRLNNYITQRKKHVPLAYIRGKAPFFGRDFAVNTHVLVPRPETETIITFLKGLALPARPKIADVGTGSGCIGITAALEIPGADIYVYDISPEALKIAARNAAAHHVSVRSARQDLLRDCRESFDVILANLPYVPTEQAINKAAAHEPRQALFSGRDGLDHYRAFFDQLAALPALPRTVIIEAEPHQHTELARLADRQGYALKKSEGFVQLFALQD